MIKDPQSVEALLTQVTQSQNPAVRTVAAVQLRKSIAKHWADLPPEARTTIKSVLLERVANETQNNVRKNVASVVSMVAKKALPAEGWPELLGFLQQCTSSGSADHREVGLMVFERLADEVQQRHAALVSGTPKGIYQLSFSCMEAWLRAAIRGNRPPYSRVR